MQFRDAGLLREAPNDVPTRCMCCDRPRRLQLFRNGPNTQLGVCPVTRSALILFDDVPLIATGFYTGSLDGV